jgi:DNA polymerase-1
MSKRLFLLDGMALVYRAHFAFIARPILTSKGLNTSALYGFTQTLLEILSKQQPTHLAVAFDTDAPTPRHAAYPEYKATRQAMPEDLSAALPHVRRMLEAFRVPLLECDGYEADDIIGTLARRAEKEGFETYMVTPDKDFGQLVDANTFLYKPSRMGDGVEILGVPEIQKRWGIQRTEQVVDVLALMGDSSDNVPGVPGVGEKTAMKLIGEFGTVENLLAHTGDLKGRVKESLETNRDIALLSKQLVTILCDAPCECDLNALKLRPPDEDKVKALLIEFEFNSIGRRLFGDDFKAGRGFAAEPGSAGVPPARPEPTAETPALTQPSAPPAANLKRLADMPHEYRTVATAAERARLVKQLQAVQSFGFKADVTAEGRAARLSGLAFALEPHQSIFVPVNEPAVLQEFRSVLESKQIEKVGHHLKADLSVLRRHGIAVGGKLFDTMVAHSLLEPDMRHSLEFLSEALLGRTLSASSAEPASAESESEKTDAAEASDAGNGKSENKREAQFVQLSLGEDGSKETADRAMENADVALQLRSVLAPLLKEKQQERVFHEIETPLIPALVEMEYEGIRVDATALADFAAQLSKEMAAQEKTICQAAGREFNLNSPRQLGEVFFEVLKICEKPKKTRTGQYATDEQTLLTLAPDHEVVRKLLEYRAAAKLKSTYADALPAAIAPETGRVHTTYNQVATATGRLNSQNPNLQNIPIRTERGQEIRKAFVPRNNDYLLLSADYSQIELRIIAGLSREAGLLEAFRTGADVHTATAAKVYGVTPEAVTAEMRSKAKMVNYGIAYGISAFGLAQRLNIPRKEGAQIIDQYFMQFPGIRKFMDATIAFAREHGYVETVTGRRRYIRDIRSSNGTVRGGAERNAINAPIQGTAADMIKIAMIQIHAELEKRKLKTRMLLQVHDELVFDLYRPEEKEIRALVEDKMRNAIRLDVPIEVETGVGENWLEAH